MSKNIGVIVGSLRKESFNRKMAKELIGMAPNSLRMEIIEIGQLPLYNEDDDPHMPAAVHNFREQVKGCDGILFVTPEYNRSIPGVLKNAIDVGSRPFGHSVWEGKKAAVISVSPGAVGGFGSNHHLRQTFVFLNILPMQQPEAYIGNAATLFDAKNHVADAKTREFLQKFIDSFAKWVQN